MLAATLFFFGSVALIPLLPTGFIPPDDNSQTQVYVDAAALAARSRQTLRHGRANAAPDGGAGGAA